MDFAPPFFSRDLVMNGFLPSLKLLSVLAFWALLSPPVCLAQSDLPVPNPAQPRLDVELPQPQKRYILGAGDRVQINVFNVPEFTGEQQILLDGSITLPLVGSITVEGLTLQQAADEITFRLSAFLERPIVNVLLLAARPLRIAVIGEVNRPGVYTLPSGTSTTTAGANQPRIPTVSELIQTAGGITQTANIRNIQVRRPQIGSTGVNQSFTVNLWDVLQGGDPQKDLLLFDGDSVFIPTVVDLAAEEASQLASANFAPDEIAVNVVGEVVNPGQLRLTPNATLNEAILTAGGLNQRADPNAVELIRLNPNGSVSRQEVVVDFSQGLNAPQNPALQNTDIIVVKPTEYVQASDSFELFISPLLNISNALRIFR
ncbi:MAG: SLBB domain-containing protein [Cyanobacteriota bacterium]|nr:SLBB domain-containing protein [Cyanobacteriota bacterium]